MSDIWCLMSIQLWLLYNVGDLAIYVKSVGILKCFSLIISRFLQFLLFFQVPLIINLPRCEFKFRSSQHFSVDFDSVRLSWKVSVHVYLWGWFWNGIETLHIVSWMSVKLSREYLVRLKFIYTEATSSDVKTGRIRTNTTRFDVTGSSIGWNLANMITYV